MNNKTRKMVCKAEKFIASTKGKKAIREVLKKANNTIDKLKKSRQIDYESLHRPTTI